VTWLSQIISPQQAPTSVLAAVIWLGGVIVTGLLIALRTLWKDNQGLRNAVDALNKEWLNQSQDQLRDSLKVTMDATARIHESERAVEAAMTMLHQIAGRQMPVEQMAEINFNLRALREIKGDK
jgi:hypothetical protein